MNRKQFAAITFNPFSTILLGGGAGIVDSGLHFFLHAWGDVLFCALLALVAWKLTPLAREHFAREKEKARRKPKPNLGPLEWVAIVPAGVMLALGLIKLEALATHQFGAPLGTLVFGFCFAAYIVILLALDLKKSAMEEAALLSPGH
jgi:cbb3-type cytochrome oxidase subunit 3